MNGWAAMVKARIDSGLTIREWCAANGVSQDAYYYRLRQLRKTMLETVPKQSENEGQTQFVQVRQSDPAGVSIRIRHGDTVIEIDNQASESLLNFLKEVLIHAV